MPVRELLESGAGVASEPWNREKSVTLTFVCGTIHKSNPGKEVLILLDNCRCTV
jgi:hypothetical protein